MTFVKTLAVGTILATTLATGAFAKAHDQGSTGDPGANVQTTVDAAHTLGERLREARGFARLSGKKQ